MYRILHVISPSRPHLFLTLVLSIMTAHVHLHTFASRLGSPMTTNRDRVWHVTSLPHTSCNQSHQGCPSVCLVFITLRHPPHPTSSLNQKRKRKKEKKEKQPMIHLSISYSIPRHLYSPTSSPFPLSTVRHMPFSVPVPRLSTFPSPLHPLALPIVHLIVHL